MKNEKIDLVSFNCLSSHLANPKEFIHYLDTHLNATQRLQKVMCFFKKWTKEGKIILLQEVSLLWKNEFELFFLENDYYFFSVNYGSNFSGNMGIAIAVPKNLYKVDKIEYKRIGELISKVPYSTPADELLDSATNMFYKYGKRIPYFSNFFDEKEREYTPTSSTGIASQRQNQAIYLQLSEVANGEEGGNNDLASFVVVNYHMPCCFLQPDIQLLHAFYLLQNLWSFNNKELPSIIGGDFNIKPDSYIYDFITDRNIPSSLIDLIPGQFNMHLGKFVSAYLVKNGEEPEFTCFSQTKWGGQFKDTLDYFFVSEGVKVAEASLDIDVVTKCPNSECPSDHTPLSVSIKL